MEYYIVNIPYAATERDNTTINFIKYCLNNNMYNYMYVYATRTDCKLAL